MYGILGDSGGGGSDTNKLRKWRNKWLIGGGVCVLLFLLWGGGCVWRAKHPHPTITPVVPKPKPILKGYQPEGIVFHHSETPGKVGKVVINAARIDDMHKTTHPDWGRVFEGKTYYIGYHYVILPDGKVEAGRPELCVGSHAKQHNNWLGICMVGAFSRHDRHKWEPSSPTDEQLNALVKLSVEMVRKYNIPLDHIKRHSDVWQTWCPGERFPYAEVMARIRFELGKLPARP